MKHPAHNTEGVNCTKTVRFYPFVFIGKEKSGETGYAARMMTSDSSGNPYIEKLYECTYVDYLSGEHLNDSACPATAYPLREATLTHFYEGHSTPQLTTGERIEYDRYHNVVRYTDLGDLNDTRDSLVVHFNYFTGLGNNLIGLRRDYTLMSAGSASVLRKARFEYDSIHGKLTRQVLYNGSDSSVYDFVHDSMYGYLILL